MATNSTRIIYGTAWKEDETRRLVELAISLGFTQIDTANQPRHYQERLVGEALQNVARQGVARESLFLQTKFTPISGHDHRIPYDQEADLRTQVKQSFASSLENLQTTYLDSYLLHGPHSYSGLGDSDWEVWRAMEELHKSGQTRAIGISNVGVQQLASLIEQAEIRPAVVQNRCYASQGWNRAVRELCRTSEIMYQGFSLLTANPSVLSHPKVQDISKRLGRTPAQVVYRFSIQIGTIPLTGTTDRTHMLEALDAASFELNEDEVRLIETIEG